MVWCCSGYRGDVWENGFYRGKSHPGRLSWQNLCLLCFSPSSFLSQSLVSANNWWCPPRFGVFSVLFVLDFFLLSTNFLSQFWISQLGVRSSLVSAQQSVNTTEQVDSGIYWGSVGVADASRGCSVFVSEAFRDNWTCNYDPICFTVHY